MKIKIFNILVAGIASLGVASCSDYLDTKSPSSTDANFVFSNPTTARAVVDGAYSSLHTAFTSHVFGAGLFYALDIAGSDIMRHPELYQNQPARHQIESLYEGGDASILSTYNPVTYGKEAPSSPYALLYDVIAKCNLVISAIESTNSFESIISANTPSETGQLYGEVVCMRATCYRELIKYYGDVPYQTTAGAASTGLASRYYIYDKCIADLQKVAPNMYPVKAGLKNNFSSTYAYALVGRMSLEAAGYQTVRTDATVNYTYGDGAAVTFETKGTAAASAKYGRPDRYSQYYQTAQKYYQLAIDNAGAATFNDDYSTFFTQLHGADGDFADESIYEEPYTQGASGNDERSYSLGRPSSGGGSNAYPCKAYGQGRINPAFYYGMFDPKDVRRDISCTITGSDGKGFEKLISFTPGNTANGGGIACGKFDENRQSTVWTANNRRSGINSPYMRISELYLGCAEAAAMNGDDVTAKSYLTKIRLRAFRNNSADANIDGFIAKEGSLYKAIIDERGFEFAGEGDRRWTLIRTGLLGEKIKEIKDLQTAMCNGLKNDKYYQFENGNVIPEVIYTKMVNPKNAADMQSVGATSALLSRLTGVCPVGSEDNPVLYPGWRGQKDWETVKTDIYASDDKSNVAIKGLFRYIDPNSDEGKQLIADGWTKTNWGNLLRTTSNMPEYTEYIFKGWDYVSTPIYLFPFTINARENGGFTNGYGFTNGTY